MNRTVPKVAPPKAGLEFSANPTTQEIFRARVFEEPLVPIGGEPSAEENAALAAALLGYAKRSGPDDSASLTGFLEKHPKSPWRAALLTSLGLEYYNTAYYSRALEAWQEAWSLGQKATDAKGKFLTDRAVCELTGLYSRLGRMNELEALLKSVEKRTFIGGATERINIAREGLWHMQNKPETSFKCGPYALQQILLSDQKLLTSSPTNAGTEIANAASTQKGLSLPQVAELSKKVGLNYQMAFRGPRTPSLSPSDGERVSAGRERGSFIIPSVVHWKVGHYAALVRQEGDRYLLEDPTFGNTVWATRQALEAETSGYFLIPPGDLARGWRTVDAKEGAAVWGKGFVTGKDPDQYTCSDEQTPSCSGSGCMGMAVSSVHLMLVNLQVRDTPVGYTPPVGPPVPFTVRYNQRDYLQGIEASFGPKWTHDWLWYITDNPQSPLANVKCIVGGGGARSFRGFDTNTQAFAPNQYDQTLLKRTGTNSYDMTWPDGSKFVFAQSDGAIGTSRRIYLTAVEDPFGNAVTLTWREMVFANGREFVLEQIIDALGQTTSFTYGFTGHLGGMYPGLIRAAIDPFGRLARFDYVEAAVGLLDATGTNYLKAPLLISITDVLGLGSHFTYQQTGVSPQTGEPIMSDQLQTMTTPYGTTSFVATSGFPDLTFRSLETVYADGSRDRVEFNQNRNIQSELPYLVPDMPVGGSSGVRNTYYWSRTACATGYGDYTKARIYHWLHSSELGLSAAGILEYTKEPLEGGVWYTYPGQAFSSSTGSSRRPTRIGRVLDDGQSQIYTYGRNGFGHVTNSIDPIGRTLSYVYASNGIDLLEVRQTRAANNELLFRASYNAQHRPLTVVDAAGQTNTFTYNARGQRLTATNPKGEMTTFTYGVDGQLQSVDGPLPGDADRIHFLYDGMYRVRAITDESGYKITLEHDDMDRLTRITYPDTTFEQFTYDRLDVAMVQDRAGRQTFYEYDNLRQVKKTTDPLGRVTLFDWCQCGEVKSLTDALGRTTTWLTDVQGRPTAKQYADGSQVTYQYESASSRLRQVTDEKQQITQFSFNRDDTLRSIKYANSLVPTPGVSFIYDPDYARVAAMTDGTGTTLYSYNPITANPALGAGALASVDGPLPNDTITYNYDELGRPIRRAINGVSVAMNYDAAARMVGVTNVLGAFTYAYDGPTRRLVSQFFPNGQTTALSYGNTNQDLTLQRITHQMGVTPLSEFLYSHDVAVGRITTWSQQAAAQPPSLHTFGYDAVNQLLSATVTNAGNLVNTFAYAYDLAGNRLTEQAGTSNRVATYNALNQTSSTTVPVGSRTNEWDAVDRLVAVNVGNQRTEFTYDGLSRRVAIRQLESGSEVSLQRFVWCDGEICEERDAAGAVTKRFFGQGMKIESGPVAGIYFYTRDHLGSIRELTDASGNVRARYAYDPYGRRTKLTGDMEADFGFAGMFWSAETDLSLTRFRAYDAGSGRWLSRDPLPRAEMLQGPNLYAYVANDPINLTDPEGLIDSAKTGLLKLCAANPAACKEVLKTVGYGTGAIGGAAKLAQSNPQAVPQAANALQCAPSVAPAAPQLVQTVQTVVPSLGPVVQSLPGLNTQIRPFLNTVSQNPALQNTMMSLETETAQLANQLNYAAAWNWFHRMNEASRGARSFLPTIEAQMEDIGLLWKMQELLFFYSGK